MQSSNSGLGRFDEEKAFADIEILWDREIIDALSRYIEIPAKSPNFDRDWAANGYLELALREAAAWIERQQVENMAVEVITLPERTPILFFEIPASGTRNDDTVLFYGHMDKQPEFTGWRSDLGPWTPKYEDGRLYGRGSADDGYAVYSAIAAIQALKHQGVPHPRIVGLIETCEESGSFDMEAYIDLLGDRLGKIGLVICPDSGIATYDRLWLTSSLRGMATGTLTVSVLQEGVHSGAASGIVPSSFRILRRLLDRLEDSETGVFIPSFLSSPIPESELRDAAATAKILKDQIFDRFPWISQTLDGVTQSIRPVREDRADALINRTWRPSLSVTGADGFPAIEDAGNVLRPYSSVKLSLRLPPLLDAEAVAKELKQLFETDTPYQAKVAFDIHSYGMGWAMPPLHNWYKAALEQASQTYFGEPIGFIGEGGTLPLMDLLTSSLPDAQIMMCGVQGPQSNAHGPNEFLHVPYAKRLTACMASVVAAMARDPE
jgi:acetylornithine deacetylase/succinyl-diaminopimelate desuccinylase-like protein